MTLLIFDHIILEITLWPPVSYIQIAFRSGPFEPGVVAEVEINVNHLSYFAVTECAVANKNRRVLCEIA